MIGIVFALISALFFGLYIIPRKLSKLSPLNFSILMASAFSFGSVVLYIFQMLIGNNEGLNDSDLIYAVLAGLLWATALVLYVKSIDAVGIARSNQWKNLQGPVGVLLALVVLNEASTVDPFLASLAGIVIFFSAIMFNIKSGKGLSPSKHNKGIILALGAGVLFGAVSVINKFVTDNAGVYSQQVIWSISILLSLILYRTTIFKGEKERFKLDKDTYIALSSGALYLGASLFMLLAFSKIESSIAFTIIQLNLFVVILLGIFVFKEISFRENSVRITAGFVLALVGVLLLSTAR